MPIYEFRCTSCGERFDELCSPGTLPPCPACGAAETERLLSQFAKPARLVRSSGDKRRSDNDRRIERERRAEKGG